MKVKFRHTHNYRLKGNGLSTNEYEMTTVVWELKVREKFRFFLITFCRKSFECDKQQQKKVERERLKPIQCQSEWIQSIETIYRWNMEEKEEEIIHSTKMDYKMFTETWFWHQTQVVILDNKKRHSFTVNTD